MKLSLLALAASMAFAAPASALFIEYVEAPPAGVFISSPFALPGFDVIFSDGVGDHFAEGQAFGAEFSIPAEAGFWIFVNGDATVHFADVNGPIGNPQGLSSPIGVWWEVLPEAGEGPFLGFRLVGSNFGSQSGAVFSRAAYFNGVGGGVIPEPATWAMLIAGFGMVGAAARRRSVRIVSV